MIKIVILDLGGVIFPVNMHSIINVLNNYYPSITYSRSLELSDILDCTWQDFEEGKISIHDYYLHFKEKVGISSLQFNGFRAAWNSIYLDPFQGVSHLIAELKERMTVVALTNTNALHAEVWKDLYHEQLSLFEEVFCSHDLGVRKPNIRAFKIILKKYNVEARNSIFVDDNQENINASAIIGIKSFCANPHIGLASIFQDLLSELD